MHADRIYVLEKGEVIETGTHEELTYSNGIVLCYVAPANRRKKKSYGQPRLL